MISVTTTVNVTAHTRMMAMMSDAKSTSYSRGNTIQGNDSTWSRKPLEKVCPLLKQQVPDGQEEGVICHVLLKSRPGGVCLAQIQDAHLDGEC